MGLDALKRKCGAHNRVLTLHETCPECVELARVRVREKYAREPSRDRERSLVFGWDPVGYHPDSCPHDGYDPQTRTCWDCKALFVELDLVTS